MKVKSPLHMQEPDEVDLRNLSNFSTNLQSAASPSLSNYSNSAPDEESDLKRNFKHLKVSSTSNGGSLLGKRNAVQVNSVVEIKKVNKKLEKLLNPNTIEFAAYYVNNMKSNNLDWQISRNFVTNMVEVNNLMKM